ncbi:MAG: LytR/AlgR family response regulator transcription factor [Paludibacteraceae bacterium]
MMLKCAIVDDEPLALQLLETYVRKTPFLQLVGSYSNALQARKGVQQQPVDLLFTDIQMPDFDGLELAKLLPATTRVVFTTAFSRYAVDSYRVNAVDYLLKPFSYDDFLVAANKALALTHMQAGTQSEHADADTIIVKSERKLVRINLDRLLYVEAMRDYMKLVLDGDEDMPVFSLMSLKALMEQLPTDRFMRVHRSFAVQLSKVRVVENNHIVFGKVHIPIGDMYKTEFFEAWGK